MSFGFVEKGNPPDIGDSEIGIPGFTLCRKDRGTLNEKKGGGVALYVRNALHSAGYDDLNLKKNVKEYGVKFMVIKVMILLWEFVVEARRQIMKLIGYLSVFGQ